MKKIIRITLAASLISLFTLNAFAQESDAGAGSTVAAGSTLAADAGTEGTVSSEAVIDSTPDAPSLTEEDSPIPVDIFFTAGPLLMVNTDSAQNSAPSPVMVYGGAGADFYAEKIVYPQARLSFFTNYYFWDGEHARPAEVENRTATVLSFLLDACAMHSIKKGGHILSFGAGLGFLARFAVLSNGVDSSDSGTSSSSSKTSNSSSSTKSGSTTNSTAADDIDSINSWLWQDLRYLYPELCVSYMHTIPSTDMTAGCELRFYLPLGSLTHGQGMDGALVAFAFKLGI